jgi:chromosome segregation ATPase
MAFKALLLIVLFGRLHGEFLEAQVEAKANPIRRVVNMLMEMQKKVTAEGEKEEELFEKFMCYCKTSKGSLADSIAAAEAKGPQVASAITESEEEASQLDADLVAHKADRESAHKSIADATAIREKAAAEYATSDSELKTNAAAIDKAVAALEKGAAGGFLQTTTAKVVQKLVESREADMLDDDRQVVLAFLSGSHGSDYSPQSGQVTGILKQIKDEMTKSIAEGMAAEEAAIADHTALVTAKTKEIKAHTKAIEEKSMRVGEVKVSIANMKNDLDDTGEALLEDKKFLAELEKGCSTKEAQWAERKKVRAEELLALSETIELLNSDDALELFKKAVPKASFVQLSSGTMATMRQRALAVVRNARRMATQPSPALDLIAVALNGKTSGFEKVTAMIDEMVKTLGVEQADDDSKKAYCAKEFDTSDDKKKALETSISDTETAIATAEEGIASLTADLKALAAGIEALDKSVAEATEQRKEENAEFTELISLDTQAKQLLGVAKNRLAKFYAPNLYMAPPKKELTQEEKIYQSVVPASSFVQITAATKREAPPPPPETFGAYSKKSDESGGVMAMVDMLIKDLDKEMTIAETEEKDAQKDYEAMMADAKAKRAADSKSISSKEGAKADLEGELQTHTDAKSAAEKELAATAEYISGLHAECDWLIQYYEQRKAARAGEVESLKNAKAVLAGAEYSLVQLHDDMHHLRR